MIFTQAQDRCTLIGAFTRLWEWACVKRVYFSISDAAHSTSNQSLSGLHGHGRKQSHNGGSTGSSSGPGARGGGNRGSNNGSNQSSNYYRAAEGSIAIGHDNVASVKVRIPRFGGIPQSGDIHGLLHFSTAESATPQPVSASASAYNNNNNNNNNNNGIGLSQRDIFTSTHTSTSTYTLSTAARRAWAMEKSCWFVPTSFLESDLGLSSGEEEEEDTSTSTTSSSSSSSSSIKGKTMGQALQPKVRSTIPGVGKEQTIEEYYRFQRMRSLFALPAIHDRVRTAKMQVRTHVQNT